jgi:6-phosphofructokinase 1
LAEGVSGVLIGEQRGEITRTPLAEIAGRTKPISTGLIDLARVLAQ